MLVVHSKNARRLALSSGVSIGELGTLIKASVGIGEPRWSGDSSATRMKSSLWAGLPWSRLPASALNDVDRVVDCYRESAANLQERFREAAAFVRNTYCVNVVFRDGGGFDDESLPKQLQSSIVTELKSLDQLRSRIDNALTAELVTQSSEVIVAELHASLENNVNAIVDGLHRVLDRLVSANVLGQLTWLPGNACRFNFHRKLVVQTDYSHSTVTEHRYVLDNGEVLMFDPVHSNRIKVTRVKSDLSTEFFHEHSHHEHHVMHAVRPSPDNSQVTMPENVQNYWESIPDWISGSLQLVHGKLIREDVSIERFDEQRRIERVEQIDVEKFVAGQCPPCPALVLGHVVLTGWTPDEIATQEKQTQARRDATEFVAAERRWEWLAGLSGVGTIALFWSDAMRHPVMNFCGWGLFAYSLFCFGGAANKWLRHWKWKS